MGLFYYSFICCVFEDSMLKMSHVTKKEFEYFKGRREKILVFQFASPHKLYQAKAQQISFHPSFNMSFLFMFILRNGLKSVANKHENCVRNILPINLHETGTVLKVAIQRAFQLL